MLTIGDRIKYIRQRRGLTQAQLAEFSGIHPVSIRKYETNKMQPQLAQIEKIADTLCVSNTAICGFHANTIRFQTLGDLMGLLILWHRSGILNIHGKRGENNVLDATSVHFVSNPFFQNSFKFGFNRLHIPDETFAQLLRWESLYHTYQLMLVECTHSESVHMKDALDVLEEKLAFFEMELQSSEEPIKH